MIKILKYLLFLMLFVATDVQPHDSGFINPAKDKNFIPKTSSEHIINTQDANSTDLEIDLFEQCKEFFVDVAQIEMLELIIFSFATIIHEFGHAITAKSLFDTGSIKIHVGTRNPKAIPQLFSLGNMHFYKTIPWVRGLTEFRYKKQGSVFSENIKLGIFTAAGSLADVAFLYALLSAITAYCAYCDNKGLSEITLKSFINGVSPFSYILNTKNLPYWQKRLLLNATLVLCMTLIYHAFYGCTPCFISGDGVEIWKNYLGINGMSFNVVHGLSVLGAWGCWALLIKKYCDARKKLSPQDSKTALPAALVSLLLMYNQLIPKI